MLVALGIIRRVRNRTVSSPSSSRTMSVHVIRCVYNTLLIIIIDLSPSTPKRLYKKRGSEGSTGEGSGVRPGDVATGVASRSNNFWKRIPSRHKLSDCHPSVSPSVYPSHVSGGWSSGWWRVHVRRHAYTHDMFVMLFSVGKLLKFLNGTEKVIDFTKQEWRSYKRLPFR
jgi:hypothetical protein